MLNRSWDFDEKMGLIWTIWSIKFLQFFWISLCYIFLNFIISASTFQTSYHFFNVSNFLVKVKNEKSEEFFKHIFTRGCIPSFTYNGYLKLEFSKQKYRIVPRVLLYIYRYIYMGGLVLLHRPKMDSSYLKPVMRRTITDRL